jgi:serine/threonine protein kinase
MQAIMQRFHSKAVAEQGGTGMAPASLQGQTLGKYRVLDPLGRGGMAQVYRAYHPQLDRYVAIKVLRSDLVEEEEFLTRFHREARAVARLRHANIVQVYDFDVQDGIYYMVMELLEGDTLKARLNDYHIRGEQMPTGEMVRILLDVLDGLAYAHSEGMIHRDIKPANIMLTKSGQAVVTDFGIAQMVGGTRHTAAGVLMGTLNYIAPEQGLESKSDARSDIYSVGIVVYEMLLGKPPFDADTPLAILMKHLNDPLPLPRQLDPAIPEPFERIVLKALAKQPEERYQSAAEMAQALRQAAEDTGIVLPDKISLPLSFTTAQSSGEAVAVLSGTARERVTDHGFAKDDTDTSLGQRPAEAGPAGASPKSIASKAANEVLRPVAAAVTRLAEGVQAEARTPTEKAVSERLTGKRGVGMAILGTLGLLAGGNMLAVMLGMLTNDWTIFGHGWPMEVLWVAVGLCAILYASRAPWLMVPISLILGNGFIFAYCAITGWWHHWALLWMLEPFFLIGSIVVARHLASRGEEGRETSRRLGWTLGRLGLLVSLVVMVLGWLLW